MAKEESRELHTLHTVDSLGEVEIDDQVIAMIAGIAATEVDGVAPMAGNITQEMISMLGVKNLSKGAKVEVFDESVSISLALNLKYGYAIPKTSAKVQDKVKTAVENMTGMNVIDVNVRIAGITIDKEQK